MYYRTYRPQTIAELDVAHIRDSLGKALLDNKWSHAYLLIGNRGTGKTSTARLIAKIVNCTDRKKGDEPCNKCTSCLAIAAGNYLDVIEVDAASNTGVDDIRDLREKVKLAPVSSPYKVYIIDEVHMLSTSAFNALLKTLEEPPEHVIFVLATTDPQKLPATIISRCMVFDFGSPSDGEIHRALERVIKAEKLKLEKGVLEAIAKKAQGSLRDAHKLLEQLSQKEGEITVNDLESLSGGDINSAHELVLSILSKNRSQAFNFIEDSCKRGKKVKDIYVGLLDSLRDLLVANEGSTLSYEGTQISRKNLVFLIETLLSSYSQTWQSPISQLPLELALDTFFITYGQDSATLGVATVSSVNVNPATNPMKAFVASSEKVADEEDKQETKEPIPATVNTVSVASTTPSDPSVEGVFAKWPDIMSAVKAQNHNLVALLRAAKPKKLEGNGLTLEVLYSFHKDQLSEEKNRAILEAVISDILATEIKARFELVPKKEGS